MRELHLFAGAGGGILGGLLLGHTPVCAVEIDPYCQEVLRARQRDGFLPAFPIHGDICAFDGTPWAGRVDVVAGGFPCQDISVAGKGVGIEGARSGLWNHMARVISEVRPRYAFVENSPALVGRGLAVVLGDLAALGYDARWTVLGAHHVGAPHKRDRIWILANAANDRAGRGEQFAAGGEGAGDVANADTLRRDGRAGELRPGGWAESADGGSVPDADGPRLEVRQGVGRDDGAQQSAAIRGRRAHAGFGRWPAEPRLGRVAHGVANRVDRLRAIGNGQVPRVAAAAWRELMSWTVPA